MHHRPLHVALAALSAVALAAAAVNGCAAGQTRDPHASGTGGTSSASGTGGMGDASSSSAGGHGGLNVPDAPPDAPPDVPDANPCGSKCGGAELCDTAHLGFDDNCNGEVDELCSCNPGQVHWCFKGDPTYHGAPGCYDGTETCNELGRWGPCIGGVHASPPDNCYQNNTMACHAIMTQPYSDIHLKTGTGQFSANAVAGSETYKVSCPTGVSQCPTVQAPDDYTPLQSGEYTVVYTKSVAGSTNPISCTFPLFVGAPGLRVELSWEHTTADFGVDLDLHVHQPKCQTLGASCTTDGDCCSPTCQGGVCTGGAAGCLGNGSSCTFATECCSGTCTNAGAGADAGTGMTCAPVASMPWGVSPGVPQDCTWSNCKFDSLSHPSGYTPHWFADSSMAPKPCNWDLMATATNNTCYNDPRGVGAEWAHLGKGCHNPRSDIDNIQCDYGVLDPNNTQFCAPENINIDYPADRQWYRIGVHYYWNHNMTYNVHPEVKVFCNGALSADLGTHEFFTPETPVTFEPADGTGNGGMGNRFWVVADVAFSTDACGTTTCEVKPIYSDATNLTPFFILDTVATSSFIPDWPPPPP